MKIKSLTLGILLCILISCQKEKSPVDYVLFSGKINNNNPKYEEVIIFGKDLEKKISIQSDGTFADTLRIKTKGYYIYKIGREISFIYIKQNDQLHLSIDPKEFYESIKYTGTASEVNNYLAAKLLLDEKLMPKDQEEYKILYITEAKGFKDIINDFKQQKLELLKLYEKLDSEFIANEIKDINYSYLNLLNSYTQNHKFFTKNEDYECPEGFLTELTGVDVDNSEDFENTQEYKHMVFNLFNDTINERSKKDSLSYEKAFIKEFTTLKSNNIREYYLKQIAQPLLVANENATTELYDFIMQNSTDEEFKTEIVSIYEKIKVLKKGNVSPTFNFENIKGGTTSLNDLKGKYVYIDVWATWCAPCKVEIPYLKKIEKTYHNKKIEFVSISIDEKTNIDSWKKMVTEKELGGIQLIADRDFNSQFVIDYQIEGIPRFILIDPEGRIIKANAPRPSDPKLISLFEDLSI